MSMKEQFVPYEFAVKLKELGFEDAVLAQYRVDGYLNWGNDSSSIGNDISDEDYKNNIFSEFSCRAPLWQQAARFLNNISDNQINITINGKDDYEGLCKKIEKAIKDFRDL